MRFCRGHLDDQPGRSTQVPGVLGYWWARSAHQYQGTGALAVVGRCGPTREHRSLSENTTVTRKGSESKVDLKP
eukprot:531859-Rhodomonas_salina.1